MNPLDSLAHLAAGNVYNNLPSPIKDIFGADENKYNLCKGKPEDYRINLSCLFGASFNLDLSVTLADLFGIKGAVDSFFKNTLSTLGKASVNLWFVDKFYAIMEAELNKITNDSLIHTSNLALVVLQANLGKAAIELMDTASSNISEEVGSIGKSFLGDTLGGIINKAATSADTDMGVRLNEEKKALETINNTATVLIKDSALAFHILMPCVKILLKYVQSRRKATTVKLSQLSTVRTTTSILSGAQAVLCTPMTGKITASNGSMMLKTTGVNTVASGLTSVQKGLGVGNFFGSTTVSSVSKLTSKNKTSINNRSQNIISSNKTLPKPPSFTKELTNTISTKTNSILEKARIPFL
jgi:hypothetical protein